MSFLHRSAFLTYMPTTTYIFISVSSFPKSLCHRTLLTVQFLQGTISYIHMTAQRIYVHSHPSSQCFPLPFFARRLLTSTSDLLVSNFGLYQIWQIFWPARPYHQLSLRLHAIHLYQCDNVDVQFMSHTYAENLKT
jgi:hypothetical protein